MPSNDIPDQDHPQQALGSHRIVWRGDGPMIAVDEDGVVTLHKLHVVPDALWNSEFWDVALPEWAETVDDPPAQFLACLVDRVGRQRIAVAELEILLPALRELRRLIKQTVDAPDIVRRIDAIGLRARIIHAGLDAP